MGKTNIAVFVSGSGTNLQALIDAGKKDALGGGEIVLVVSDKPEAFALKRARKSGIGTAILEKKNFDSTAAYDEALIRCLKDNKIGLVVLAGFMRILSKGFVKEYENRILNVHPALLPSFKGAHGIKDAFEYGVKMTGVTVHYVTDDLDAGPIILQSALEVGQKDDLETLETKIHKLEHSLYPKAVRFFCEGRLKVKGRRVYIRE